MHNNDVITDSRLHERDTDVTGLSEQRDSNLKLYLIQNSRKLKKNGAYSLHVMSPRVGTDADNSMRRLSSGDKPHWLEKFITENEKDETHASVDYLLGRAIASSHSSLKGSVSHNRQRSVRVTEVAPSNGTFDDEPSWKLEVDAFSAKKRGKDKTIPKRIRSYYKAQDDMITAFEDIELEIDNSATDAAAQEALLKKAALYAKITFFINILLFLAKCVAVALSGSISIISSLLDSAMDLVSGVVIWYTSRAVKKRDPYVYPQGRTKLEPIGIVILAVVMAVASVQIIKEAAMKMIGVANETASLPIMNIPTLVIAGSTIVVKLILYLVSRPVKNPSIQALAQDHRNDVLSNLIAVVFGYVGSQEMFDKTGIAWLGHLDPIGAILISIYIIITWGFTAYKQIKMLTGYTAKPEFLRKLTWICINHHQKVEHVETVRAFHFGNNFLVEVHIVLPASLSLMEAHDIGEPLQQKLEKLPNVERAFVHIDYEALHDPRTEHKMV